MFVMMCLGDLGMFLVVMVVFVGSGLFVYVDLV